VQAMEGYIHCHHCSDQRTAGAAPHRRPTRPDSRLRAGTSEDGLSHMRLVMQTVHKPRAHARPGSGIGSHNTRRPSGARPATAADFTLPLTHHESPACCRHHCYPTSCPRARTRRTHSSAPRASIPAWRATAPGLGTCGVRSLVRFCPLVLGTRAGGICDVAHRVLNPEVQQHFPPRAVAY
jgi:hypothetical protein